MSNADSPLTVNVTEKGGTIDNGGYNAVLSKDLAGAGKMKFVGSGKTTIATSQSAPGLISCEEGEVFIANGWQRPEGLCESAWETMSPFVMALSHGAEDFYEGWMKNPKSAMISCNDGFRPVSFLIETLDEEVRP